MFIGIVSNAKKTDIPDNRNNLNVNKKNIYVIITYIYPEETGTYVYCQTSAGGGTLFFVRLAFFHTFPSSPGRY